MEQSPIKKGTEVNLTIESLAYGGKGVAKVNNFVVFVKNAIPGQIVRALIYKKRSAFAEARPIEILKESANATAPRCKHFAHCGGCTFQQLDYAAQIEQKKQQVIDAFQRLAGLDAVKIDKVIPSNNIYNYRNKMEFTFSNRRWRLPTEPEDAPQSFALGLHIPGRFDKILDINECHIQPKLGNEILNFVREKAIELNLKPYDAKTNIGYLRHLVLRFGVNTNEIMVNIVTSYENTDFLIPLVQDLIEKFPQITSVVNNINTRKADVAFGEYEIIMHGTPVITDKIGNLTFEISSNSFFQTNTLQAEKLYQAVIDGADLNGEEIIYDLYCGTGSISLFLAHKAKAVYGFEMIRSAVDDAQRNAEANGIENVQFYKANLDTHFKGYVSFSNFTKKFKISKPDVVVIDPPRAGMHEDMVYYLPKFGAKKIVYISCNPTTQARDLKILFTKGYQLNSTTMVDMFPHTPHIETVVVLKKI
ncbi:23S rRNA (uracil(1939)-C(5))-methyltransferase RlmD [bacterium]|nr:23S rRNA (uracil(1939)-C(5))-methyltransferase RlmD [bacterium]